MRNAQLLFYFDIINPKKYFFVYFNSSLEQHDSGIKAWMLKKKSIKWHKINITKILQSTFFQVGAAKSQKHFNQNFKWKDDNCIIRDDPVNSKSTTLFKTAAFDIVSNNSNEYPQPRISRGKCFLLSSNCRPHCPSGHHLR